MSEQENLKSVRQVYQGFVHSDLGAIVQPLAEDVDWQIVGHFQKVPWPAAWRGRRALERYFTILAEALEVEIFQPDEFIVDGDNVVVLGHERMVARATGRIVEASWAQVWTFREGLVIRYREYTDSAAWEAAYA
jgi:ketosteroid isomerase-like protein